MELEDLGIALAAWRPDETAFVILARSDFDNMVEQMRGAGLEVGGFQIIPVDITGKE